MLDCSQMLRSVTRALPAVVSFLLLAPLPAGAADAVCESESRYGAIAPFLGEWRIVAEADGRLLGTTRLTPLLGGCAVEEVRELEDGSRERALLTFDASSGRWQESWATSRGESGTVTFVPSLSGVTAEGVMVDGGGEKISLSVALEALEQGGFRERTELSTDDWATREALPATLYLPAGRETPPVADTAPASPDPVSPAAVEAAPATPEAVPEPPAPAPQESAPEPAPTAAPAPVTPAPPKAEPAVKVRSERKREASQTIEMESPMTLEFELGPVHRYPEGAAWRTDELRPYRADDVSVALVDATRRGRKGKHRLVVTVHLRATTFQRSAAATVELLDGGEVIASADTGRVKLGKMIGSHDPETGRPVDLEFDFSEETLTGLFSDGAPIVRLTVAVE